MANMSYCRFRNTEIDLEDCLDSLNNGDELSKDEFRACEGMLKSFFEFLYEQGIIDGGNQYDEIYERLEDYLQDIKENSEA